MFIPLRKLSSVSVVLDSNYIGHLIKFHVQQFFLSFIHIKLNTVTHSSTTSVRVYAAFRLYITPVSSFVYPIILTLILSKVERERGSKSFSSFSFFLLLLLFFFSFLFFFFFFLFFFFGIIL